MTDPALEEIRELRRQRDDARDARDAALAKVDIAEEILQEIERGRRGIMGEAGSIYTPQISVVAVERWRERLNPKPVPMCRPDPCEGIFPPPEGSC